jgi:hypothetical protein
MIDLYVILTPVLLLAVVALLQFVGCNQIFGLDDTTLFTPINFVQLRDGLTDLTDNQVATAAFGLVTPGHLMVVWVWYHSSTVSVATVTDTAGNAYQLAVGPTNGAGGLTGFRMEIWYGTMTNGGTNFTVTATFTGSVGGTGAIAAHEYSDPDKTAPLVATSALTGTDAIASSGVVTASGARLVFGAALFRTTGSVRLGFNPRDELQGNLTEDKAGTVGLTMLEAIFENPNQEDWIVQMAAFK